MPGCIAAESTLVGAFNRMSPKKQVNSAMITQMRLVFVLLLSMSAIIGAGAATLILPQNRSAFYADETIELAVAGLSNGEQAKLELQPAQPGNESVPLEFVGTDGTVIESLPPFSLAPGTYKLVLDGVAQPTGLTVSTGVLPSTFLLSNAVGTDRLHATGADCRLQMHSATACSIGMACRAKMYWGAAFSRNAGARQCGSGKPANPDLQRTE